MAKRYKPSEVRKRLEKEIESGNPIIIGSAGNGLMAKLEEKGGIDIIGVYNSGWMRYYGVGSLGGLMPVTDTNRDVMDLAKQVLPRVEETPVIAGLCGQDPRTPWDYTFDKLKKMGFSGIMSFPTVGLIDADSKYRKNLEESGWGFDKEVEMLKKAKENDMFTIGYCFTEDEARKVAGADVDILACHTGLTAGGEIGAETTMGVEESIEVTERLINAAKEVNDDFIPITHGGVMATPDTTEPVIKDSQAQGYLGASSIERTPVEPVVPKVVEDFKDMELGK